MVEREENRRIIIVQRHGQEEQKYEVALETNNRAQQQRRRKPRKFRSKSHDRIIAITKMNYAQYINFQLKQGIPREIAEMQSQPYARHEGRLRSDLVK